MAMGQVEFKYLESKVVGNDCIVFRLEDGTQAVVRVDIMRAGNRINEKGEVDYHFEFNNSVKIIPADKKFKVLVAEQTKGDKSYVK